jgi:hypothetical protein
MRKRTQKVKIKIITILSIVLMAGYVHAIGFGDIAGGLLGGGGSDLSGSQDTLTASLNQTLTDLTTSQKIMFKALDQDKQVQLCDKVLEGLANKDFGTKDSIDKVMESSSKLTEAQAEIIAKKEVLSAESKVIFVTSIPFYIKGVIGAISTGKQAVEAGQSIASLNPMALLKIGALISIVSKTPDLLSQLSGTTSSLFEFMAANDIDSTEMKQKIKF